MAAPDRIRIPLDEERFGNVGRLPDGRQFMAYVTGAFPGDMKYPAPSSDWRRQKRWLAVIHQFDAEGNHLHSETRLGGYDIEGREIAGDKAWEHLEAMYAALTVSGEPEFCDIWPPGTAASIRPSANSLSYSVVTSGNNR